MKIEKLIKGLTDDQLEHFFHKYFQTINLDSVKLTPDPQPPMLSPENDSN